MGKKYRNNDGKILSSGDKRPKGGSNKEPRKIKSQRIEEANLSDLKPFPGNPRHISDEEYKLLLKNLKGHGDVSIMTVDEQNRIIGGNQRLKAMKELKWKTIAIKRLIGYTENELKAINLALNKISGNWDVEQLDKMLAELATSNFDMELTGFPGLEIENLNPDIEPIEENRKGKKNGSNYTLSFGFKSKTAWMGVIEWNGSKRGNGDKLYRILKKSKII